MFANAPPNAEPEYERQVGEGYQPPVPSAPPIPPSTESKHPAPTYPQPPPPGYPQSTAYGAPPPQVQPGVPPPAVAVSGYPANQPIRVPARIAYFNGAAPPQAPTGYAYVYHEQVSPIAILLCVLFFPWGILFLLCMKERYWQLTPVAGQQRY